ncbi:MAG TPA: ATP-binding protein [Nocardioides sp.]|nr:ATP-binding protein [Nocardioides sp.]
MRDRSVDATRGLLFAFAPDPRVLQGIFGLLFGLDLVLRFAGPSEFILGSWPTIAVGLGIVACAMACLVPWSQLPPTAVGVLPMIDIAALGLSRLNPEGSGAGILAVLPALWLGQLFGRRGAVITGFATAALLALPGVLYLGTNGVNLSRSLLIPVVAVWTAVAIASGLDRIRQALTDAEDRGRELAQAVVTIEHQRRVAEAIVDTVDVGLILLDRAGGYQSMNRRHEDFMRLAFPDGHAGQAGQLGFVYGEDAHTPLTREAMPTYRASRGEEFDDCRLWVGEDPLTRRALSCSARSVRDEEGDFAGAALAYKDVTDFMRALRVKDEFVASVSHELRTPLTSIVGYVNILLEREDLPREGVAHLEVVARNTDRLRRLVADLLHTARSDDGPMAVTRTPTDLSEIVQQAVTGATPAAHGAGVKIDSEVPDRLEVMVDAQRMAQVVDNLLSNAIKYSHAGGLVRVRLAVDAGRVELSVADEGIGILASDRDRLFTRFFRARYAEEQSIQGVGLGLSITKSIVEAHGGRIEVESEPGVGSMFRVRLPFD